MAIYRFETKNIGRADNKLGRSVVACAAYRSASRLYDEKYDYTPDYTNRTAGVVCERILTPDAAPSWAEDRGKLWNGVERSEDTSTRRKEARLAREFIPALPHELTREQREALVMGFAKDELVSRGMVVDVCIHEPKEGLNYHAHLLCTTRSIGPEGFGKKNRDWNKETVLEELREAWEVHTNAALEAAGRPERVDRRSLADRGLDATPQPKLGPSAAALERKGIETERGELVRDTIFDNRIRGVVRSNAGAAPMPQYGIGATWWEQAQAAFGAAWDTARELLRDETSGGRGLPSPNWQHYEAARRETHIERSAPDMEFG